MANLENLKKRKPFVKNDPRINRTGLNRKDIYEIELDKAATPENVQRILQAIAKKAMKGDVRAAEFIFDRLFGKVPSEFKLPSEIQDKFASLFPFKLPVDDDQ